MEVIVLAGGRGTRLSSVVSELPKPMAPVAGRPFLAYLLDLLIAQGVSRICLSTGYLAGSIQGYFAGSYGDAEIVYAQEISPLGTGGAIRAALPCTTSKDVFVVNGDTLAEVDMRDMMRQHQDTRALLTVALTWATEVSRYGAVAVRDGKIEGFTEKGCIGRGYINAGVYLIRRDLFSTLLLPEVFSFEEQVLRNSLNLVRPCAYVSSGYFLDIGVPEDYIRAQSEMPYLELTRGSAPQPARIS